MPEYEPAITRYFAEPITVSQRYALDQADLPLRLAEAMLRQDRQRAEARAGVDRLLASVFAQEAQDGR